MNAYILYQVRLNDLKRKNESINEHGWKQSHQK